MAWYYASNGHQLGPVEEAALDDLVRQGVVRDDTLVWKEGMAAWQRHADARGYRAAPPAFPGAPAHPFPGAPMPPPYVAARRYAGFWIRFLARVIDVVLIGVV